MKTKPTPTEQRTLVTFLLDRTGSMQSIKSDTIGGFNAYLEGLQAEKDAEIEFTLLQFDSQSLDKVCVAEPVASVKPLTDKTFEPRASTPLIEATVKTINAIDASLKEREDKPKIIVCILTDGQENSSAPGYTWDQLNKLVTEKTAAGWQFNFMGAGINAYVQAAQMGVQAMNTMSYNSADAGATRAAFTASSANAAGYSAGRGQTTNYSVKQRADAGDSYAQQHGVGGGPTVGPAPQPAQQAVNSGGGIGGGFVPVSPTVPGNVHVGDISKPRARGKKDIKVKL